MYKIKKSAKKRFFLSFQKLQKFFCFILLQLFKIKLERIQKKKLKSEVIVRIDVTLLENAQVYVLV